MKFKYILILLSTIFTIVISQPALALECHLETSKGITEEREDIGQLAIPIDLPIGSIVWRSNSLTRNVFCWSGLSKGEPVYFYSDPDNTSIGSGLEFGIIYNGIDLGNAPNRTITDIILTKKGEKYGKNGNINYQIYLKKIGEIPIDYQGLPEFSVFQLDGEKGINKNPGKNYRFTVTGLDRIRVLPCHLEIPDVVEVDFGELLPWEGYGHELKRKPFSLELRKSCDAHFSVDARFTSSLPLVDAKSLDLNNGATLKIYDPDTSQYIHYGQFAPLANMDSALVKIKHFDAILFANGKAKLGAFSADVIVSINYK